MIFRFCERSKQEWLANSEQEHQWNIRRESSFKDIDKLFVGICDWNKMFLEIEKRAEKLKHFQLNESSTWEIIAL